MLRFRQRTWHCFAQAYRTAQSTSRRNSCPTLRCLWFLEIFVGKLAKLSNAKEQLKSELQVGSCDEKQEAVTIFKLRRKANSYEPQRGPKPFYSRAWKCSCARIFKYLRRENFFPFFIFEWSQEGSVFCPRNLPFARDAADHAASESYGQSDVGQAWSSSFDTLKPPVVRIPWPASCFRAWFGQCNRLNLAWAGGLTPLFLLFFQTERNQDIPPNHASPDLRRSLWSPFKTGLTCVALRGFGPLP